MGEKKLGQMAGTPWHIGYITKKPDDPRRDKRWCKHYKIQDNHCSLGGRCPGSSHCKSYRSIRQDNENAKIKMDLVNWQAQSKQIRVPNMVQIYDTVRLHCYDTNVQRSINIPKKPGKQSPVAKLCLGKHVGSYFDYNGYRYKIVKIHKWKQP